MKVLNVNGRVIKYSIWDTSGQEKYYSLAPMYYRNAAAALLVYDITAASSFKKLEYWVSELRSNGPENVVMLVVGNKADLSARRVRAAYAGGVCMCGASPGGVGWGGVALL